MKLFPDIEKAIPLPHEKVLRFAVRKIRNNYSEQWLEKQCLSEGVAEGYAQYSKQGIFDILEGNAIRSFYPPKLTIELVPRRCWFDNVRSAVTVNQWDSLRKKQQSKQNGVAKYVEVKELSGLLSVTKYGNMMMKTRFKH